VTYNVMIY